MAGRPAHYNYLRLIGRLEAISRAYKRITAFLLDINVDGDACKIVVWARHLCPRISGLGIW